MGTTEQLARFVVDTRSEDIPGEAIARGKLTFIDIIGVALAATAMGEAGPRAIKYVKDMGGHPEASVLGGGLRACAANAALVNAHLAHISDYDDWGEFGHPSCMLVAASLAVEEKLGAGGRAALEAYTLGLEVYARVAGACTDLRSRGWHSTPVFGTLGSTVTAARLLGLDVHQTVMALGIAGCEASGIYWLPTGTMVKGFQVGNAARSGVEAALLAKDGFTGPSTMIEDRHGFCNLFAGPGNYDLAKMTEKLGDHFRLVSPGVGLKPYPCRYPNFRAIQGVLEIRAEHGLRYEDVDWVEVRVSPTYFQRQHMRPKTGLEGKFSHIYCCAVALLDGKVTLTSFSDDKVQEPRTQEALSRIRLTADEGIPEETRDDSWSPVTIRLKDGRTLSKQIKVPKGDPRNPMPVEDVLAKYRDNACLALPQQEVQRSVDLLLNLEQLQDLGQLMEILRRTR